MDTHHARHNQDKIRSVRGMIASCLYGHPSRATGIRWATGIFGDKKFLLYCTQPYIDTHPSRNARAGIRWLAGRWVLQIEKLILYYTVPYRTPTQRATPILASCWLCWHPLAYAGPLAFLQIKKFILRCTAPYRIPTQRATPILASAGLCDNVDLGIALHCTQPYIDTHPSRNAHPLGYAVIPAGYAGILAAMLASCRLCWHPVGYAGILSAMLASCWLCWHPGRLCWHPGRLCWHPGRLCWHPGRLCGHQQRR